MLKENLIAETKCRDCGHPNPTVADSCARCGKARYTASSDPLIGQTIAGRFYIVERLGQGQAGTLYRAEHVTLRRRMAVKLLHKHLAQSDDAVERFRREAITVCEIDNDHIPQVYDFGRTEDGRLFFAVEFLEGEPLSQLIGREGRLAVDRTVDILAQIADGLVPAHTLGYIHRDLRPRNIFLSRRRGRQDFIKLLDFGLAKLVQPEVDVRRTAMGTAYGDPHYMAPEQARGDTIDRRADIYALGALGFEMLTGEPPFVGDGTFTILGKVLDAPVPRVRERRPDCPAWLESVVRVALAKPPSERFQTVTQFLEALERKQVLQTQPKMPGAATAGPAKSLVAPKSTLKMGPILPLTKEPAKPEPAAPISHAKGAALCSAKPSTLPRADPTPRTVSAVLEQETLGWLETIESFEASVAILPPSEANRLESDPDKPVPAIKTPQDAVLPRPSTPPRPAAVPALPAAETAPPPFRETMAAAPLAIPVEDALEELDVTLPTQRFDKALPQEGALHVAEPLASSPFTPAETVHADSDTETVATPKLSAPASILVPEAGEKGSRESPEYTAPAVAFRSERADAPAESTVAAWFVTPASGSEPAFADDDSYLIPRRRFPGWALWAGAATGGLLLLAWVLYSSSGPPAKGSSSPSATTSEATPAMPTPPASASPSGPELAKEPAQPLAAMARHEALPVDSLVTPPGHTASESPKVAFAPARSAAVGLKVPAISQPADENAAGKAQEAASLVHLGKKKLDDGEAEAAAQSFARAAALDPHNADAIGGLGEAAFEQGDFEEALRKLEKGVHMAPRKSRYREALAAAQFKLGRYKAAAETCHKLLKQDPANKRAKQTLEQAKKKLGSALP